MRRHLLTAVAGGSLVLLASCATEPETKPVGPTSESSGISWTGKVSPPIQGQLGMLPQNQHRR